MARFRCIADQCEDTCCGGGLIVALTRDDVSRLEGTLEKTPEGREALERSLIRTPVSPDHVAVLSEGTKGCGLLTENKLCGLLARGHPATALPDVCHLFPRRFAWVPGHVAEEGVQMVAALACPEAARLVLGSDDGLELEELPPSTTELFPDVGNEGPAEPYHRPFRLIQGWGLRVLQDRRAPLPARMLAIAELGRRLDDTFHRNATEHPESLEAALQDLEGAEALARISQAGIPEASVPALVAARFWLLTALPKALPRGHALISACVERWTAAARALEGTEGDPSPESVARAHLEARAALGARAAEHDRVLERYCAANWMEEPYFFCPSVGERAFRLAVRTALVRALLLFHPGAAATDPTVRSAAAVEAVQIYSRHVERDGTIHRAMGLALPLGQLGMDGYGRTALFAGTC
jgi:lysine-N-methylase